MRNVTIVVAVLITSCQLSEKPNIGPVTTHASNDECPYRANLLGDSVSKLPEYFAHPF